MRFCLSNYGRVIYVAQIVYERKKINMQLSKRHNLYLNYLFGVCFSDNFNCILYHFRFGTVEVIAESFNLEFPIKAASYFQFCCSTCGTLEDCLMTDIVDQFDLTELFKSALVEPNAEHW